MQRGFQWAQVTTHSFWSWKERVIEESLSSKICVLMSIFSLAFWTFNTVRQHVQQRCLLQQLSAAKLSQMLLPLPSTSQPWSVCTYLWAVCSSKCKSAYISPSRPSDVWSTPTLQECCSDQYTIVLLRSWGGSYVALLINKVWVW